MGFQRPTKGYLRASTALNQYQLLLKKLFCLLIPVREIFIRSKQGLDHKHVGSLHAVDAAMAIENARDVYTRRMEGVSIWAVESKFIHASNPTEAESLYDPSNDKAYRHPTFYDLPEEVKYM